MKPSEPVIAVAINGFFGRGGTERQIVEIATGLRRRGRDVRLFSRWPIDHTGEHGHALHEAGVPVESRGTYRPSPSVARRIAERARVTAARGDSDRLERPAWQWQQRKLGELASAGPVIVHEIPYFGRMPKGAVAVHNALRLPVVQTVFGSPEQPVMPVAPWAVLTSDGAPSIADGGHYEWIPSTTLDTPAAPAHELRVDGDRIKLVCVSRLAQGKGVDLLIRAVGDLPHVHLTVVGDGPEADALRAQAKATGAEIAFVGSLDRQGVLAEMQAAHVTVIPSLTEGLPTVVAESLSQGKPVLASAVGGIPRLLGEPEAPGWLVPPGDVASLRDRIEQLTAADVGHRAATAFATYARYLRSAVVLDAYEKCYATAIGNAGRAQPL